MNKNDQQISSSAPRFDTQTLYQSIDAKRQRNGLTWVSLAQEVGVSVATIRRYSKASDAEADGVLALIRWLGVAPEYFANGSATQEVLSHKKGFVRVDTKLVAKALDNPQIAKRDRMTIQQLTVAAWQSQRSIASLTRLRPV